MGVGWNLMMELGGEDFNLRYRNQIRGKLLLLENYSTSEGAVSHNVVILSTSIHYSLASEVLC